VNVAFWGWAAFVVFIVGAFAFDLGLLRRADRQHHELTVREATLRSAAWIGLALLFGLVVVALDGPSAGLAYTTAYLLEESLSIDNIFVFVLIFSELQIPPQLQRGVLLWGVIGALIARALLIGAGIFVISRFHWVVYPFAALIIFAAVRLLFGQKKERELVVAACSVCSTWVARLIPITPVFHGGRFFVREGGRLLATPLFVALVIIETSDIVFALDSVPAVLAVTRDPFIVYTSNVFAMLGLRSLYFVLAGAVQRFRYLPVGLAAILIFFGAKLLLSDVVEVPNHISLMVIAVALSLAVGASVWLPNRGQGAKPA
jgi:tellurite resistance protein TerC